MSAGLPHPSISALVVVDGSLYAATAKGVARLVGDRWETLGLEKEFVTALAGEGNTLYAGTWRGNIYRSNDRGKTWELFANTTDNF